MAIEILSQPLEIEPVYSIDGSNLAVVLDSDDSALFSFKYVQEVSILGNFIVTTKVSPNVGGAVNLGKGVLSANRILEDFVSYDLHDEPCFQICGNSFVDYSIQLGEENDGTLDGSGGTPVITLGATVSGYIWNGTVQYNDDYDYTDFLVGLTSGITDKLFLTNAPRTQEVNFFDNSFLYWLNGVTASGIPAGSTGIGIPPLAMEIIVTGPTSSSTYYIFPDQDITDPMMLSLGVGPADINRMSFDGFLYDTFGTPVVDEIINCNTVQYTVQLTDFTPVV